MPQSVGQGKWNPLAAGQRQLDTEGCTCTGPRRKIQVPPHQINQLFNDRQPQAGTALFSGMLVIKLREDFKNLLPSTFVHADTTVGNLQQKSPPPIVFDLEATQNEPD